MEWFGKRAKDIITGFTGTAVGYRLYCTGCNQILLAPAVDENGTYWEPQWFDEQRVEIIPENAAQVLDNASTPGPDRAAPKK